MIKAMENGNQPATKQDLRDLESRLTSASKEMEGRLTTELEERMTNAFTEAIRDMETKLVGAFYGWAEASQKHFVDLERSDISIRDRIDLCERRIAELERFIKFPGSPQS